MTNPKDIPTMDPETRIRVVFATLAADDMDGLVENWAEDGIYYNPAVGPPAHGKQAVKSTIATMSTGLQERHEEIVIDRISLIENATPLRAYVEWHIQASDTTSARHGLLGVHVITLNEIGMLHRVTVFAHRP